MNNTIIINNKIKNINFDIFIIINLFKKSDIIEIYLINNYFIIKKSINISENKKYYLN